MYEVTLFLFLCFVLIYSNDTFLLNTVCIVSISKFVPQMSWLLGLQASELVISMKTVWARCPNGDVARRYGITDKNPAGDYWKKIPGNVSCLAGEYLPLPLSINMLFVGL